MLYSDLKKMKRSDLEDELKRQQILDLIDRRKCMDAASSFYWFKSGTGFKSAKYPADGFDKHMARIRVQAWVCVVAGGVIGVGLGYLVFFSRFAPVA